MTDWPLYAVAAIFFGLPLVMAVSVYLSSAFTAWSDAAERLSSQHHIDNIERDGTGRPTSNRKPESLRDWIIGLIFTAVALLFIFSWGGETSSGDEGSEPDFGPQRLPE